MIRHPTGRLPTDDELLRSGGALAPRLRELGSGPLAARLAALERPELVPVAEPDGVEPVVFRYTVDEIVALRRGLWMERHRVAREH